MSTSNDGPSFDDPLLPEKAPSFMSENSSLFEDNIIDNNEESGGNNESLTNEDEEIHDLALDAYNMFFICDIGSVGHYYSLFFIATKMSIYVILLLDLLLNSEFPFQTATEVSKLVMTAQFLMIPTAIIIEEELMTSFFIIGSLKWSEEILDLHPGAVRWKYYFAHGARTIDGFLFFCLFIVTMFQVTNGVLQMFINFAALMFIQGLDKVAIEIALDGFVTKDVQKLAQDVKEMKLVFKRNKFRQQLQKAYLLGTWFIIMFFWVLTHFVL